MSQVDLIDLMTQRLINSYRAGVMSAHTKYCEAELTDIERVALAWAAGIPLDHCSYQEGPNYKMRTTTPEIGFARIRPTEPWTVYTMEKDIMKPTTTQPEQAADDRPKANRDEFKIPNERKPRTIHYLKSRVLFYEALVKGTKNFEIRQNDRNYQVGDILILREWDDRVDMGHAFFTGREIQRIVTYLTDFGQKPGFVVLGITR